MLASSGTEETISYFLLLVHQHALHIIPNCIMSNCDFAQINACRRQFPTMMILLCWWHVLHSWQQHLSISCHPELWKLLKAWVRIAASVAFEAASTKILEIAPLNFLQYLQEYWLPVKYLVMWLAVYCKGHTVYELSDTNMLIEAWVSNTCLCCPKAFYPFPTGGTMYSRESFLRVIVTVAWTI